MIVFSPQQTTQHLALRSSLFLSSVELNSFTFGCEIYQLVSLLYQRNFGFESFRVN